MKDKDYTEEAKESFRKYIISANGVKYKQYEGSILESDVVNFLSDFTQQKVKKAVEEKEMDRIYSEMDAEQFIIDWYAKDGIGTEPDTREIEMVAYIIRERVKHQREVEKIQFELKAADKENERLNKEVERFADIEIQLRRELAEAKNYIKGLTK